MEDEYDEREWDKEEARSVSEGDEVAQNELSEQTIKECMSHFSQPDYIMEPNIFNTLKKYFLAGGGPETVIDTLCTNYKAVSGLANLIAEWLILAGVKVQQVQALVENHLKDMILRTFDPARADTIFSEEGVTPGWLSEIIKHPTWRSLVYRLAEDYPDCMMLNFTIKLISDAGFQGEITSLSTASQQIEVFSRIVRTLVTKILSRDSLTSTDAGGESGEGGREEEDSSLALQAHTAELAAMVCHGQHTYVYTQALLHALALSAGEAGVRARRVQQEVTRLAVQRGCDVTPIILALNGAAGQPRAAGALAAMLARQALNPADITVLYKLYSSSQPPPVQLLRSPTFLELLVEALFKPGTRVNPDHRSKYVFLLAYAASVSESADSNAGERTTGAAKDELAAISQALERVCSICHGTKGPTELLADLHILYQSIRFPVVSVGLLYWVQSTVTEPSFFKLCTEHTPIHLTLLDEIVACHPLLHDKVLQLYVRLFESDQSELEILVQLEMRKMLLDRLVCLLARGAALPVVHYITRCWRAGDTDVSLIRYFVHEVLQVIAPPYSPTFSRVLLPLVESAEITAAGEPGCDKLVTEFIQYCYQHKQTV